MRVMFVCTTGGSGRRQLGGAERFLVEMLPALARHGVDVVACTPDDEVANSLRRSGVPWIRLGASSRIDLGYAREIRRYVEEFRPDVVSAHLLSAAMHSRAALGIGHRQTPLVIALHNSLWQYRDAAESLRQKASVQANITLDLTLRRLRPHATVAVSDFEAAELRVRGRVKNVHTIPNPLPATWPDVGSAANTPRSSPIRIGFLGRLEQEKGADLLSEIASAMPDIEFVIAGTGTVRMAPLPNITLVGRVDAADFLQKIDCLLVPSRVESFGRSALEAMSLGVPVVHSGVGGLAELTRPADGCLAYRADLTPTSMASAIRRATDGASVRARRHEVARWYAQEFSFARCVQNWLSLYRTVAHGSG